MASQRPRSHSCASVPRLLRYRKLPDHHYYTLSCDCLNASIHFLKTLETYGVDSSQVVLCGDSLGARIVALISQTLVGILDLPQIRAQVLIYPLLQLINFSAAILSPELTHPIPHPEVNDNFCV